LHPSLLLRALALALPLSLAAAPPAVLAKTQKSEKAHNTAKKAAVPVVATPFPADADQHLTQLNGDAAMPVLKSGARGAAVLRAQVMLDRAWFSPGQIDGVFAGNMKRALGAFQLSRGLPTSGRLDEATWAALAQPQAPLFATYVLTEQDVSGPYVALPKDPVLQSRLPSMGYESAAEALAERFHMSPALMSALNQGRPLQAGQAIVVPDVRPMNLPATVSSLRIDKSDRMLYVMGEGNKVLGAFPVSIGSPQDPLPEGRLKITSKVKDPDYSYNPDLLRNPKASEKVKLPPGPNSPVGVMWLGLTREHWGIHGTAEPAQMARVDTNGCIRLTNWDVLRLSTVAGPGMLVEVQS
jgi:lipoprotein-anchoring transpeptidase ErfK/SrfK